MTFDLRHELEATRDELAKHSSRTYRSLKSVRDPWLGGFIPFCIVFVVLWVVDALPDFLLNMIYGTTTEATFTLLPKSFPDENALILAAIVLLVVAITHEITASTVTRTISRYAAAGLAGTWGVITAFAMCGTIFFWWHKGVPYVLISNTAFIVIVPMMLIFGVHMLYDEIKCKVCLWVGLLVLTFVVWAIVL